MLRLCFGPIMSLHTEEHHPSQRRTWEGYHGSSVQAWLEGVTEQRNTNTIKCRDLEDIAKT